MLIASCFTKALWPDFSGDTLETAIASFQNRNRRFGGLKETTETEGAIRSETTCHHSYRRINHLYSNYLVWWFCNEIAAVALAVVGVYELFRMKGLTLLSFEGVLSALGAVFSYPDN